MSPAKRAGGLVIVAVLVLGLAAPLTTAEAKKKRKGKSWPSEITLSHPAATQFNGTVESKLDACRAQRLVTVYYTDPQTGQTLPLSVQRTDKDGRYAVSLTMPAYPGSYRAEVSEQKVRAMKAKQTCKGAQSLSVSL
jgi:hypothetical protein